MRGKLHLSQKLFKYIGITPAGAGKTVRPDAVAPQNQDHPRRCGENTRQIAYIHGGAGSPPQVRGKRESFSGGSVKGRITPAGAGKTAYNRMRREDR